MIQLKTDNIPGEIKITTHQYFLAGGASVQLKGVQPDVVIPGYKLNEDALESANDNPIPFNEIDGKLKTSRSEVKSWIKWKDKHLDDLASDSSKTRRRKSGFPRTIFEAKVTDTEAAAGHKKDEKGFAGRRSRGDRRRHGYDLAASRTRNGRAGSLS